MMKQKTGIKAAVLATALLLAAALSGCTANPDTNTNQSDGSTYPYKTYVPQNTVDLGTAVVITPTPNPGLQNFSTSGHVTTPTIGIVTQIPTSVPTVSPAPTSEAIKLGSSGDVVRNIQTQLKKLGYYKGTVDGDFGEGTDTAVKAFQSRNGLTPDGVVGSQTMTKLLSKNAIAVKPTPSPTRKPTATPAVSQNVYLKYGDSGKNVRDMQSRLINLGYLAGSATGNFDKATEAAVIAFQKRNTSYYDGIAGPMTLSKLYSSSAKGTSTASGIIGATLEAGSEGNAVRVLQTKLKSLGFYSGTVDGSYGAGTTAAVKAFQAANGLTADGKAGSGTLNKLFSGNANEASPATKTPAIVKVTPTPKPTPIKVFTIVTPDPNSKYVSLREGNMGTLVSNLQQALFDQGYYTGVIDGMYGAGTTDAVTDFQSDHGLSQDGVAGYATQTVLFEGAYPDGA
jgi:peptidoglycan hydrolase-like protein with peptidoglycan-binding domain